MVLAYLLRSAGGGVSMIIGYIVIVSVISAVCTLAIRKRDMFTEAVDSSPVTEQSRSRPTAARVA